MIKEGDVVNFFSTYAMWQNDYHNRNPGVIIETSPNSMSAKVSAVVLWANGEITSEHGSYLRLVGKEYHDAG
tara:strand:- start:1637 stop:1852 length:216 start_codon:yes stop_codon:yes gene_type:complete